MELSFQWPRETLSQHIMQEDGKPKKMVLTEITCKNQQLLDLKVDKQLKSGWDGKMEGAAG